MKKYVAVIAALMLAGCGGGGGGDNSNTTAASAPASSPTPASSPAVVTASAQGIYNTSVGATSALTNIVLPDGSFYIFNVNNAVFTDIVIGDSTVSSTTINSTNAVDFSFANASSTNVLLAATYVSKQTLNGSLTISSQVVPFASDYNQAYDNTIALTQIAGAYTGANATLSGPVQNQITVKPDLSFIGVSSTCQYAGQLTASHGSLYTVTITFPAGCPFAGTAITGIATFDPTLNQLTIVASPQNRADVFLAIDTMPATAPSTVPSACSVFAPSSSCSPLGTVPAATTPASSTSATPATPASSTTPAGSTSATPTTPASGTTQTGSGTETCTNPTNCTSAGSTTTGATAGT